MIVSVKFDEIYLTVDVVLMLTDVIQHDLTVLQEIHLAFGPIRIQWPGTLPDDLHNPSVLASNVCLGTDIFSATEIPHESHLQKSGSDRSRKIGWINKQPSNFLACISNNYNLVDYSLPA